jgi:hypothetical protein
MLNKTNRLHNLPSALAPLQAKTSWVLWRWQRTDTKPTKVPFQPDGRKASSTNRSTWSSYAVVIAAYVRGGFDGIGFVLEGDITAFDIDNCIDPDTDRISPWVTKLMDKCGSYSEITISGTGIRIIGYGSGAKIHRKLKVDDTVSCEIYRTDGRYIVVTGHAILDKPLVNLDQVMNDTLADLERLTVNQTRPERGGSDDDGILDVIPTEIAELLARTEPGLNEEGQPYRHGKSGLVFGFLLRCIAARVKRSVVITACHTERPGCCIYEHCRSNSADRQYQRAKDVFQAHRGVTHDDFYAYMPLHNYIYTPTRDPWPAASVNARVPPVPLLDAAGNPVTDARGKAKVIPASVWLDQHKAVEQMTWAPGLPMVIPNRLIATGGWIKRCGVACFNLYRPPTIDLGDATKADRWLDHVRKIYPEDADHLICWFAHRAQRPADKINHAIVLGGLPGIGKDTLLEPVKQAVGPWNFHEVSPKQVLDTYNDFLRSTIMRVNEARDLGDVSRFEFYDSMKAYTAAPPDVLRVNEKYLRQYYVPNCVGVVITTNYKDALFLPPEDRRTYVAWSELAKEDFGDEYWKGLWAWYYNEGFNHVAAYLTGLDISTFNAKAPPPKTRAFWAVVDLNRSPEDAEVADRIDAMGNPDVITVKMLIGTNPSSDLSTWLTDRKYRRSIPHRLERCGYVVVHNPNAKDGVWKIEGVRHVIYAKATMTPSEQLHKVNEFVRSPSPL